MKTWQLCSYLHILIPDRFIVSLFSPSLSVSLCTLQRICNKHASIPLVVIVFFKKGSNVCVVLGLDNSITPIRPSREYQQKLCEGKIKRSLMGAEFESVFSFIFCLAICILNTFACLQVLFIAEKCCK